MPVARFYHLAERLWPDDASRLIVRMNQGVLALQRGQQDEAIATFRLVLAEAPGGYLGAKHESACHYNLAVAYQKKGLDAHATLEFPTPCSKPGRLQSTRAMQTLLWSGGARPGPVIRPADQQ